MKVHLALSIAIILMGESINFTVENTRSKVIQNEQRILLRRLQNLEQHNSKDDKIVTWNEIFASALVNKINIFPSKNDKGTQKDIVVKNGDVLQKCFSEVLYLYKKYVFDTFINRKRKDEDNRGIGDDPSPTEITQENLDNVIPILPVDIDNNNKRSGNEPKGEVEIFEPRLHGRITNADGNETVPEDCPEGLVRDKDGRCSDPKFSQCIRLVPNPCPNGYRRDGRGVCRMVF